MPATQERLDAMVVMFRELPINEGWPDTDTNIEGRVHQGFAVEAGDVGGGNEEDVRFSALRLLARNCAQYEAYRIEKDPHAGRFENLQIFHDGNKWCWYCTTPALAAV
jgi:hypothetical protein